MTYSACSWEEEWVAWEVWEVWEEWEVSEEEGDGHKDSHLAVGSPEAFRIKMGHLLSDLAEVC
jgi:hypothetical protein